MKNILTKLTSLFNSESKDVSTTVEEIKLKSELDKKERLLSIIPDMYSNMVKMCEEEGFEVDFNLDGIEDRDLKYINSILIKIRNCKNRLEMNSLIKNKSIQTQANKLQSETEKLEDENKKREQAIEYEKLEQEKFSKMTLEERYFYEKLQLEKVYIEEKRQRDLELHTKQELLLNLQYNTVNQQESDREEEKRYREMEAEFNAEHRRVVEQHNSVMEAEAKKANRNVVDKVWDMPLTDKILAFTAINYMKK